VRLALDADTWNARYRGDDHVYGTELNDFLAEVAAHIPPGPVLCVADGEGATPFGWRHAATP
jgi:hypothetical protein